MEITKDELIANLYAIRAGLSVISQERDKMNSLSNTINKAVQKQRQLEKRIGELKEKNKKLHSTTLTEEKKERIKWRAEYDKRHIEVDISWLTIGIPLFITVILLIPIIMSASDGRFDLVWFLPILILVAWIPSICIIVKEIVKVKREKIRISQRCEDELSTSETDAVLERARVTNALSKAQRELEEQKMTIDETQSKYAVITPICAQKSQDTITALTINYSHIVSVNDWASIDMLIYYLSTGRADTIKEALQLYDRQRQTDEIVRAINEAQTSICNMIQTGFVALGKVIVDCFSVISNQLAQQHEQTMETMGTISKQLSSQEGVLTDLQDVLTAKMRVSSQKLAEDMNSMQYEIRKLRGVNY